MIIVTASERGFVAVCVTDTLSEESLFRWLRITSFIMLWTLNILYLVTIQSPGTRLRLGLAPFVKGGGERQSRERGIFPDLPQGYILPIGARKPGVLRLIFVLGPVD